MAIKALVETKWGEGKHTFDNDLDFDFYISLIEQRFADYTLRFTDTGFTLYFHTEEDLRFDRHIATIAVTVTPVP